MLENKMNTEPEETGRTFKTIRIMRTFEKLLDKYGPVGTAARFATLDFGDDPDQIESGRREFLGMVMEVYGVTNEQIEEYISNHPRPAEATAQEATA